MLDPVIELPAIVIVLLSFTVLVVYDIRRIRTEIRRRRRETDKLTHITGGARKWWDQGMS